MLKLSPARSNTHLLYQQHRVVVEHLGHIRVPRTGTFLADFHGPGNQSLRLRVFSLEGAVRANTTRKI